jgi:hypothetical protein
MSTYQCWDLVCRLPAGGGSLGKLIMRNPMSKGVILYRLVHGLFLV